MYHHFCKIGVITVYWLLKIENGILKQHTSTKPYDWMCHKVFSWENYISKSRPSFANNSEYTFSNWVFKLKVVWISLEICFSFIWCIINFNFLHIYCTSKVRILYSLKKHDSMWLYLQSIVLWGTILSTEIK